MASEPASADSGTEATRQRIHHHRCSVHEFGRKPQPNPDRAQHRMTLGASEFSNTSLTGMTSWGR
jgi:hypothetical protein